MTARGPWELPTARLLDLRRALAGAAAGPLTITRLQAEGFDGPPVTALAGMPAEHARTLVDALVADRAHRPPAQLDLVWSGPESAHSLSRDTSQVVRELFAAAEARVIVASYAFRGASSMFQPLHDRALERALEIEFFIHVDPTGAERSMTAEAFYRHSWPWSDVRPRVYVDARGPDEAASMHAKCVVVDDTATLITSANFTGAGHHRNVELGVLIRDRAFGGRVAAHWRALAASGLFVALNPGS